MPFEGDKSPELSKKRSNILLSKVCANKNKNGSINRQIKKNPLQNY